MLRRIDDILNRITMYRLVLYYLIALLSIAFAFSAFGVLPYHPAALAFSTGVLLLASWIANRACAIFLRVQTNVESATITALILALIITPPSSDYLAIAPFLIWVSVWAMASKYILNIRNKHLFNPAAFAVALTSLTINQSASWWVGGSTMIVFVLVGGLLVVRKVRRFDVATSFIGATLITIALFSVGQGNPIPVLIKSIFASPLIFFAAVMITEPLTMPPTRMLRIFYGVLVGVFFVPQVHIAGVSFTPELALIIGNVFSYFISPKGRYVLALQSRTEIGSGVDDFVFRGTGALQFRPGQYMEWTLGHSHPDRRGNRRYFTIASSPTEQHLLLGIKFYPNPSSFKQKLLSIQNGDVIVASQLAGDFVMPQDPTQKLAFIAGGIGVTPFRSMTKYLIDRGERRSIVLLYSNKTADEIVYSDIFAQAQSIGVKTVYTLTDTQQIPANWLGARGYITPTMIAQEIPDYAQRVFYISGSHTMVTDFKTALITMGVPRANIKTDFFPGLA